MSGIVGCIVTELPMCLIANSCAVGNSEYTPSQINTWSTLQLALLTPSGFQIGITICLIVLRCAGYTEVSRVLANNWLALPTFKVCVSQTENYAVLQEHKINARWAKRVQEKKNANLPFFSTRSELKLSMLRSVHFWELEAFFFLFIVLHAWKLTFYQTALMHNVENNNNCEANPFALLAVVKCRSCWHVGWHFVAA